MPDRPPEFAPTRWTLVLESSGDTPAARAALAELCDIYYAPVVNFIRHWRHDRDEDAARDQAHAFFESLLERDRIGDPSPERGRFRSYLLGAVKNFLNAQRRASSAAKRGGDAEHQPLDENLIDTTTPPPDEAHFDRAWALALIGHALTQLESEMTAAGKASLFAALRPWLDGNADTPQSEVAAELGMSETAVKVAIHRLRERFRTKIRHEVASTLDDPSDLDREFQHLVTALARA